jgi:hypothetical protein
MKINPEIVQLFKKRNIDRHEGLLYLLGLYYGLDTRCIPELTKKQVNACKVAERNYMSENKEIVWNIGLFEGQETDFEWVAKWREPFKEMNPGRAGILQTCIARMKKLFRANPTLTKEDAFASRDAYLRTVNDPMFLKKSHKFIYEQVVDSSMLMEYLALVEEDEHIPNLL